MWRIEFVSDFTHQYHKMTVIFAQIDVSNHSIEFIQPIWIFAPLFQYGHCMIPLLLFEAKFEFPKFPLSLIHHEVIDWSKYGQWCKKIVAEKILCSKRPRNLDWSNCWQFIQKIPFMLWPSWCSLWAKLLNQFAQGWRSFCDTDE